MNKKYLIIIIALVAVLLVGIGAVLLIGNKHNKTGTINSNNNADSNISSNNKSEIMSEDFKFILDTYKYDEYEIKESYFSLYDYFPKTFIEFVLEKYVNKTKLKNVIGMEVEYAKQKNLFNSLYGMSVTNMIRDEVVYDNDLDWLDDRELTNEEIIEKLNIEKKKAFMNFATGVWVTSYARSNLLKNIVKLDDHVVYRRYRFN